MALDNITALTKIIEDIVGKSIGKGFGWKSTFDASRILANKIPYTEIVPMFNAARQEMATHVVNKTVLSEAGQMTRKIVGLLHGAKFELEKQLAGRWGIPFPKTTQVTPSYSISQYPKFNIGQTVTPLLNTLFAGQAGWTTGRILGRTPLITDPQTTYDEFYRERFQKLFERKKETPAEKLGFIKQ